MHTVMGPVKNMDDWTQTLIFLSLFCNLKTYVQDFHNKTHATETSLFAPGPFFLLCLTNLEE